MDERPDKLLKRSQLEGVFVALELCLAYGILEYWNAGNWETAYIFLPIIPLFQNSIIPVGEQS